MPHVIFALIQLQTVSPNFEFAHTKLCLKRDDVSNAQLMLMSLCFPFQTIKLLNKELLTNTNTAYTWMMSVEVKLFFLCKKGN